MEPVERKFIHSASAPRPGGPYSHGVQVGRTLYLSGQIAIDPKTGSLVSGGIEVQTRQVLENVGHVLKAADLDYRSVVKATVLLADINDFNAMNAVYKEFFKDNYPARVAYQVGKLPMGSLVEIEAIAIVGPISNI